MHTHVLLFENDAETGPMPTGTDYLHVASRIIMGQDYNFGAIKTD